LETLKDMRDETEAVVLNYRKTGEGREFIILHGFLGSLDNWATLSAEWARHGLCTIALDLRNHGRSPHTDAHSIPLMAADVIATMNELNLEQADILGHSMGGKVAMHLALHFPTSVRSLIVADMAPRRYAPGSHDPVFNAIRQVDLTTMHSRKDVEAAMTPLLGDFGTRQFILKGLYRDEATGNYKWRFNIETLEREYANVLEETNGQPYEGKVLFLRGENSLYVKEQDHAEILKLFPHAQIETVPNAGHWLHADQPGLFSAGVLRFLQA
jgi:pimeloyl-ACP methyl ester carboxylesterase